jgi:hypothetical protein
MPSKNSRRGIGIDLSWQGDLHFPVPMKRENALACARQYSGDRILPISGLNF